MHAEVTDSATPPQACSCSDDDTGHGRGGPSSAVARIPVSMSSGIRHSSQALATVADPHDGGTVLLQGVHGDVEAIGVEAGAERLEDGVQSVRHDASCRPSRRPAPASIRRRPRGRCGSLPSCPPPRSTCLVTMPFSETQLDRLRRVSPDVARHPRRRRRAPTTRAPTSSTPARRRATSARAPNLKWVQLHMAGVDALAEHPLYTQSAIPLVTASGVHAATIAEYAITTMLALAHRVPRMVEWQHRGTWPPDEQRWPLFVPERAPRRHARHHRLRQHRPRAGAHGQGGVRDDRAGLQARPLASARTPATRCRAPATPRAGCPTPGSDPTGCPSCWPARTSSSCARR